jgi:hypothetical protein
VTPFSAYTSAIGLASPRVAHIASSAYRAVTCSPSVFGVEDLEGLVLLADLRGVPLPVDPHPAVLVHRCPQDAQGFV